MTPVQRSLDYYTQLQKELEMGKVNSDFEELMADVSHTQSNLSHSPASDLSAAHKFRVHKISKGTMSAHSKEANVDK